jgi:AcrR family transcriptional regulator
MPVTRTERMREASRQRRDQQKHEVRQAILDAAAALFLEHGYQGFSLRQVAERIGYSATTIYLYFADKDDLLFTVAEEGFGRFGAQLQAAAGTTDPLERLAAIGRTYVDFGLANPAYYRLMFMERADFLMQFYGAERKPRLGTLDIVVQAVQEGIDAGTIRSGPAQAVADALWAAVHGVVALHLALPVVDRARAEQAAIAVIDLMIAGMRPR